MIEKIKFSIAIPAYKGRFLYECIESVLSQTYKNLEVIIVDDNSPEDLFSIVNKFKDERIQYYRNEIGFGGENVVGNWNKCLEHASGEFVICMGDDDKLKPNCLADYVGIIEKYPDLDLYHTRTEIIDENSTVYNIQEPRPLFESVYSLIWYRMNGRRQYIGDFLFRTSTLKDNGGFYKLPTGCCSDDISACIAAGTKGVANTQIPGFQYRDNRHTLSRSGANMQGKAKAFMKAKEWYKAFIANSVVDNKLDLLYQKLIITNLGSYINANMAYCCKMDVYYRGVAALKFWCDIRKEYNISLSSLIKNYIFSLLK